MALADSALDYSWEVVKIATENSSMTVKYSTTDSSQPDVYRRWPLLSTQFDSAGITSVAEGGIYSVLTQWDQLATAAASNPSFDDTSFVGKTNNTRFKTNEVVQLPDANYNKQLFKVTESQTETADAYVTTKALTALDSDEKVTIRQNTSISPQTLWEHIIDKNLITHGAALGFNVSTGGELYAQTSFDASAAGSFDWSTDKISSFGVASVTRTGTGAFDIVFSTPRSDTNYTVVSGQGEQDYSGAGSSPRQVTVTNRTATTLSIVVERTDDAVNEDNGYISVVVLADKSSAEYGSLTSQNIGFLTLPTITFGDEYAAPLQTSLGLNDSDFVTWLDSAGGYISITL